MELPAFPITSALQGHAPSTKQTPTVHLHQAPGRTWLFQRLTQEGAGGEGPGYADAFAVLGLAKHRWQLL